MADTQPDAANCRLVIFDADLGPHAAVYPLDANSFTNPDLVFPVAEFQELPPVDAGAPARIDSSQIVHAGGVAVRPCGPVVHHVPGGGSRLFAERGDVVVNPVVAGWNDTWQRRRPDSLLSPEDHIRRGRHRVRAYWGWVAYGVLFVVGFAVLTVLTGRAPILYTTVVFGLGASIRAAAHRRRHALVAGQSARQARTAQPGPTAQLPVRLWWSAGVGDGPVAIVELQRADGVAVNVPVTGVPNGFSIEPGTVATVSGPVGVGLTPSLTINNVELWPTAPGFTAPDHRSAS